MTKAIRHILAVLFLFSSSAIAQNPEGFGKMADQMRGKGDTIGIERLYALLEGTHKIYLLDTREAIEYAVSHMKGALYYGYNKPHQSILDSIPKDAIIVTYCSVGYRSGKVSQDLKQEGYKEVYNLYGGLFNWANNNYPIYRKSVSTKEIHGYNAVWSKWANGERLKIILP